MRPVNSLDGMPFARIDLRLRFLDSAMRRILDGQAIVEVWLGLTLLGELSGESIRQMVAEKLSVTDLALRMRQELDTAPDPLPLVPPPPPPTAARRPPQALTPEQQSKRRQQRRARR